jgi:hypothetical protein
MGGELFCLSGKWRNGMDELARLDFVHRIRTLHYDSLWEEEKHFTWLNSLILSAQVLVITSDKISAQHRLSLSVVLASAGFLCSALALAVIRREGDFYYFWLKNFVQEYNRAFPDGPPIDPPPGKANKSFGFLLLNLLRGKLGIRDAFQILFVGFMGIFVIMAMIAWVFRCSR